MTLAIHLEKRKKLTCIKSGMKQRYIYRLEVLLRKLTQIVLCGNFSLHFQEIWETTNVTLMCKKHKLCRVLVTSLDAIDLNNHITS